MLAPNFAVVAAQDDYLSFLISQRGKMRHLNQDWLQELCSSRSDFHDFACASFALHERRRMDESLTSQISAGDPHGHLSTVGWDDHSNTRMAAASHCTSARVNHETDQEPVEEVCG